ncbi:acyltransferase, partial [bacterium]|nr:acyltransferase [bacterium]
MVLFHAFPAIAPGGFTGVDAFFVISGFLITSIIDDALDRGAFRFPGFWGRRVRRLFPALALVLATVLVAGWVLFSADELERLGREIAAGASFTANLFFATQRGYFHPSGSERPLLHLWSLAIEEQFYLAWPVVLWLLHRLRLPRAPLLALLTAASFAWNLSLVRGRADAAFYSTLARVWELGLGGLLATTRAAWHDDRSEGAATTARWNSWLRDLVSAAGLGLLVAGLRLARPDAPYPGTTALLPTVGTALVLAAGPGALVNRTLLANRAIIGLGLVSYPLYLWHWPLLSFASILDGRTPAVATRASVVALSLLLAWVTWRFAEIPAREAARPSEATRTRGLVAAVATLGLLGWWIGASGGARGVRAEPAGRLVGELGNPAMHRLMSIYPRCPKRLTPPPTRPRAAWSGCQVSRSDRPPTVALLGDSHAVHLLPGLAETLTEENVLYQGRDDAPFATGPEYGWISRRLASEPSVHAVVLSAFWSSWREPPAGQTFEDAMRRTVETFTSKGKNVILVA